MMRALLLTAAAFAALWSPPSQAQNVNLNCYVGPNAPQWLPCSATNPLPTTGGGLSGNLGNNVDNVAPVTTGNVGADSYEYVFDGTNWQRAQPVNAGTAGVPGTDVLTTQPPLGTPVAMQSAAVANGNGTVLPITTYPIAIVNVVCSVTCSGGTTVNFEGTDSTGTFFAIQGIPLAGGAGVTTATAGGQWVFNTAGLVSIRARISAYSAGTITVTGNQAFGSTASGAGGTGAINSWAGSTLGAIANYGTSPGAVLVPGVNASVTASALPTGASTSANQAPLATFGATYPASAPGLSVDISGNAQPVSGQTAGGINSAAVTVYDTTGTPLNGFTPGTFAAPSSSTVSVVTLDPCTSALKSSVAISVTSATTTSLVATSGTTTVYVCGYSMTIAPSATSADTALIERGTGAACVTTQAALTGTYGNGDLTTAAPPTVINYGNGASTVVHSAGTDAICLVTAGTTVNVQGVMTYVQQ